MLDEDCIKLVRMVKAESKNLKLINFSSNMSIINKELLDEISSTDCHVVIGVSIDGPAKIHNYVRHRSNYDELVENIRYVSKNYPNIKLAVHTTVSALTVGYLPEILDNIDKIQQEMNFSFHHFMINPVVKREFLDAGLLPQDIKDMYLTKLKSYQNPLKVRDSNFLLSSGIELLNSQTTGTIEQFKDYIQSFDRVAKTNILDVYPEFSSIFNEPNK
jgi:sulfatase maturation enzyme AslB (radical SAM superfamily)